MARHVAGSDAGVLAGPSRRAADICRPATATRRRWYRRGGGRLNCKGEGCCGSWSQSANGLWTRRPLTSRRHVEADWRPRGMTGYLGATLHERNVSCLLLRADLSAPCGRILGHLLAAGVGAGGARQSQAGTIYVRIGAAALHVLYTITACGIIGKYEPSPQGALASSMIQSRLFLFRSTHVMTNTIDNEGGGPRCTTVHLPSPRSNRAHRVSRYYTDKAPRVVLWFWARSFHVLNNNTALGPRCITRRTCGHP